MGNEFCKDKQKNELEKIGWKNEGILVDSEHRFIFQIGASQGVQQIYTFISSLDQRCTHEFSGEEKPGDCINVEVGIISGLADFKLRENQWANMIPGWSMTGSWFAGDNDGFVEFEKDQIESPSINNIDIKILNSPSKIPAPKESEQPHQSQNLQTDNVILENLEQKEYEKPLKLRKLTSNKIILED